MSKKCRYNLISFDHVNLYMLLIILRAFLKAFKEHITSNLSKLRQGEANEPGKQHPVIITINYAMGLCLSFILLIIYKLYNKRNKNKNILNQEKIVYTHNKRISKKEKFFWILLAAPFDFFATLIYSYNWIKEEDILCYWPTNIILMALFSYLILKKKLFKHHYLSIIIITVFGLAHNFVSGLFEKEKIKQNYKGYIIYFFAEGTLNVLYVLYKFFMIKKFIKSYGILFFEGLIELILGIILLVITTKYYPQLDSFITYFKDIDGKEIAIFCSLILINFFTYLTIFIIIDIFTPFYTLLLNILSEIISGFFAGTYDKEIYKTILYFIFMIICFFMVLVFTEIIQLNFCGLSTMTKKNIEERAKLDSIIANDNKNNFDNDSNMENTEDQKINVEDYTIELLDISNSE